uniref:RING-type domain-containing protein n=1 Tax=Caenorhabditis tropicalis TaxID=1561998 RepID=A0A1I7T2N3_9PELO
MSDNDRKVQLFLRIYIGSILTAALAMYRISSKYGFGLESDIQAELRAKEEKEEAMSESDSSDEEESGPSYTELKCGVCLRRYSSNSEKRIPRLMKCGHTEMKLSERKKEDVSEIKINS